MEQPLKQFLNHATLVKYNPPSSRLPEDILHIQTYFFPSQMSIISKLFTRLKSLDLKLITLQSNLLCTSILVETLEYLRIQMKQVLVDEQTHDPVILEITKLPCLKVLCLNVHQLSFIDYKSITLMTQLTSLQLTNIKSITEENLRLLANLKNLQSFGLLYQKNQSYILNISEVFVSLPFLTSLTFRSLRFTPQDLIRLSALTKLTSLNLEHCISFNLLTSEGLQILHLIGQLKELQQLNITGFLLQSEGFLIIKEYPHLKILIVNDCQLSFEDIKLISTLPALEELEACRNSHIQMILGDNKPNLKRFGFSFSQDIEQAKQITLMIMTVALCFKDLQVLRMNLDDNEDKGFDRFCLNRGLIYLRKLKKMKRFECSCYVPQMYMMVKSVLTWKSLEQFQLYDLYHLDNPNEEMKIHTNKQDIRRVIHESKLR